MTVETQEKTARHGRPAAGSTIACGGRPLTGAPVPPAVAQYCLSHIRDVVFITGTLT